ncbi:hypothetical protein WA026_005767 [Henosepilachna vigintioctopunctata]|uniref:Ribosomal protein S3 n=1 Tax=Henosepilachna vigintioctopunctata TaxID=420089 RepID=A0AAW1U4X5_9CUCU
MVDLKNEPTATPKKSRGISMTAVKNWLMPDKKIPSDTPKFQKMPDNFLRSLRRRSLRIKRTKSLVLPEKENPGLQGYTLRERIKDRYDEKLLVFIVGYQFSASPVSVTTFAKFDFVIARSERTKNAKKTVLGNAYLSVASCPMRDEFSFVFEVRLRNGDGSCSSHDDTASDLLSQLVSLARNYETERFRSSINVQQRMFDVKNINFYSKSDIGLVKVFDVRLEQRFSNFLNGNHFDLFVVRTKGL